MNDDILKLDPVYEDYEELKQDPEIQEDVENIIEESKKDERKAIDQSGDIIYSGILTKFNTNRQTLNLNNFDSTLLWTNPSPTAGMNASTLVLDDDMSNYEYIMIEYKPVVTLDSTVKIFFPVNDLEVKKANSNVIGIGGILPNGQTESARYISKVSNYDDRIFMGSSTLSNTQGVPINIYGLNAKTISTPDPTPTPNPNPGITTSGNVINNYYNNYYGVSENSVSWNIMNKPFNEYTVTESYFAITTLLFLSIGIYLIIRRSIFKWR